MVRLSTWLLTTPILVVGLFVGHEAGYRIAIPDSNTRAYALDLTHHGYFGLAPVVVIPLVVIALFALGLRVRAARAGGLRAVPSSAFAALPPIAFVLLEASERLRGSEHSLGTMASPEVVIGLALQLPFAVLALVVARLLGSLADIVGVALRPALPPVARTLLALIAPVTVDLPGVRVAALPYGTRGPPVS